MGGGKEGLGSGGGSVWKFFGAAVDRGIVDMVG